MRENNLKLMPHQDAALRYALPREYSYLGLDMGLGKTAIALSIARQKIFSLVICPAYLRNNWKKEALMWGFQEQEVQSILSRKDKLQYKPLTIVSYDATSVKNILSQSMGFDLLIVDEAHYLRGRRARRTKYILGTDVRIKRVATQFAEQVIFLSGTPMLNRPRDLWPILKSVYPEDLMFRDYMQYAYRYCAAHDTQWGLDDKGASNIKELKSTYLEPFMLRMKKEDVLDLPEKIFTEIDLELNKLSAKLIKEERELNLDIEKLSEGHAPIGEYATLRRELGLLKIFNCIEHIRNVLDQCGAVVVFTFHQQMAEELANEFNTKPITGATPHQERERIVNQFQEEGGVFVGTYGAAGTGITLTKSSNVVLCELDYSPRVIDQAIDRCHRIGQQSNVYITTLLWREGLERTLYKQLQKKDKVFFNLF